MKGIEAFDRVEAKISAPTSNDTVEATIVMSFVNGFLSVHDFNSMIYQSLEKASRATPPNTVTPEQLRLATLFAPLRNLPDGMTMRQTLAITKKYLANNPQKWHEPADFILLAALSEAFPAGESGRR